jgi:Family of unknown function (DUF695)
MIGMGLRGSPDKQHLPFFLTLPTTLTSPTSNGLPTRDDADNPIKCEEAVEAHLRPTTEFVFLGRVTWNGHRELLYYLAQQQSTVEALRALSGTRRFAFTCERDEKWARADYWLNH